MAVKQVKVTINGQDHILTWSEEHQAYESTLTAPNKSSWNENDGHYYSVKATATDDAGNETTITDADETFGEKLKLLVEEKNAPTIEIVYPTASSSIGNASPRYSVESNGRRLWSKPRNDLDSNRRSAGSYGRNSDVSYRGRIRMLLYCQQFV